MLTIKLRRVLADTPQAIIFEFGACNGVYTRAIFMSCPSIARFYSFEPDPRNIARVTERAVGVASIVPAAIGNVTGKVPFYLASAQPNGEIGSSSISPFKNQTEAFPWCKCEGTVHVDSWRLDDFCAMNEVGFIDLIFMDIQGAERLMIEGAQRMLKSTRYIWTEFEGRTIDSEGTCYEHSSSLERILQLLPGWRVIEDTGGDALLFNPHCTGNPHPPADIIGG